MKRVVVLLSILLAACDGSGFGSVEESIVNGEPSGGADDTAVAVAIGTGGVCSGVLIASNLIATARHCVSLKNDGPAACDGNGNAVAGGQIFGDVNPKSIGILVGNKIKNSFDAFGAEIFHGDSKNLCNNDLALVRLDRKLDKAPIAQLRLTAPPKKGEKLVIVGWGDTNFSSARSRNRRADVPIISLGPDLDLWVGPNEIATGESICGGDSGGPAFSQTTGALIATTSRGGNQGPPDPRNPISLCLDSGGAVTNYFTRIDKFKPVFDKAFAAAGAEPWLEGQPDPRLAKFSASCSSANECGSKLCVNGMCSQSCALDDAASCPTDFVCQAGEQGNVCQPASTVGGCRFSTQADFSFAAMLLAALLLVVARRKEVRW